MPHTLSADTALGSASGQTCGSIAARGPIFVPIRSAPDALLEAARRIDVEPGRMLSVGDSWVAAAAGQRAGVAGTVLVGDPPSDIRDVGSVVVRCQTQRHEAHSLSCHAIADGFSWVQVKMSRRATRRHSE